MPVYFVGVEGDPSRVKIGKTNDVGRRLTELARRFPAIEGKLVLLAEVEGYSHVEAWLHNALRADALGDTEETREWFHLRGDTLEVCAYAREQGIGATLRLCPEAVARDRTETHVPPGSLIGGPVALEMTDALKRETDEADARWLEEAAALDAELAEQDRELTELICRESLYEFFCEQWPETEPGTPLDLNWHLRALCHEIQAMLEGWLVAKGRATPEQVARVDAHWALHGVSRIEGQVLVQNWLANLPPSTLKSRVLMVVAPAWMMLHDPTWSCLAVSGVDDNVRRDSTMHRDLISSQWYRRTFAIKWTVRPDVDAVGDWATTAGGERKSRTMLGGFSGIHVDCILLDDPEDAFKVYQESERKKVQAKWRDAIRNRHNNADIDLRMAIQQRVHVDDWTSAQLAKSRWSIAKRKGWAWWAVPVRWGRQPVDAPRITPHGTVDPRSCPESNGGIELLDANLHPARFTDEMIADEMSDRGEHGWAAQYDQNPESLEGGMFARAKWRFCTIEGAPLGGHKRPPGCVGTHENVPDVAPYVIGRKANGPGGLDLDWISMTVDCTFGSLESTASQVSILLTAGKGQRRFVLADVTRPMTFLQTVDAIVEMIRTCPAMRLCLIEKKANGAAVIETLTMLLAEGEQQSDGTRRPLRWSDDKVARIELEPCEPEGGKVARAIAMLTDQRAGMIYLLDGAPWLDKFVAEVSGFPNAKKDDRVDALSQLMHHYNEASNATKRAKALNTW